VQGALLAALLFFFTACADAADAAVATDVPAGKAKTIRIRGVPAGATVAVRVVTNGPLLVALVGAKHLKAPGAGSKPLFRGEVRDKLAFRVAVTEADDYVLVLSNRGGQEARSVEAQIRATGAAPKRAPQPYSPRPEKASWSLSDSSSVSSERRARECAASARRCASQ